MTTSTDQLLQTDSVLAAQAPHVREHFGLWGIQPEYLQAAVDRLNGCNFSDHLRIRAAADGQNRFGPRSYSVLDGVAIIEIRGPLTKRPTSFSAGTSTIEARQQLRHAARDKSVEKILLVIESPGGAVAAANKVKPVVAYVEDLCASCAYWVASQAGRIYANRTALVGGIGTYIVLRDVSEAASRIGLRVTVVKAGQHKGIGVPGAAITADQVTMIQHVVNALNEQFLVAVAAGRKIPIAKLREFADGRVQVGQEAVQVGLIDGVKSFEETLAALQSHVSPSRKGSLATSTPALSANSQSTDPIAEFDAAVQERMTASGLSKRQAISAVVGAHPVLHARYLSASNPNGNPRIKLAMLKRAEQEAASVQAEPDAVGQFNRLVEEKRKPAGMTRGKAVAAVVKANPELHRAFLVASNPRNRFDQQP